MSLKLCCTNLTTKCYPFAPFLDQSPTCFEWLFINIEYEVYIWMSMSKVIAIDVHCVDMTDFTNRSVKKEIMQNYQLSQ